MDEADRRLYRAMESRYLRMLVLDNMERYPKNLATRITKQHEISGPALYREIRVMVKEGILLVEGKTSARTWRIADPAAARKLLADLKPKAEKEWRAYWEWRKKLLEDCRKEAANPRR